MEKEVKNELGKKLFKDFTKEMEEGTDKITLVSKNGVAFVTEDTVVENINITMSKFGFSSIPGWDKEIAATMIALWEKVEVGVKDTREEDFENFKKAMSMVYEKTKDYGGNFMTSDLNLGSLMDSLLALVLLERLMKKMKM